MFRYEIHFHEPSGFQRLKSPPGEHLPAPRQLSPRSVNFTGVPRSSETPTPLGSPKVPRCRAAVGSFGGGGSYERGTPVQVRTAKLIRYATTGDFALLGLELALILLVVFDVLEKVRLRKLLTRLLRDLNITTRFTAPLVMTIASQTHASDTRSKALAL